MSELGHPVVVKAADVCRDGGSYVLVYADRAGTEFEIEVPVIVGPEGRIGYERPQILNRSANAVRLLTWEESAHLAEQLRGIVISEIAWGGRRRLDECLAVMLARGAVPGEA